MTNEREANVEENVMKISSWYCINLPLAPSIRGNVATGKRISKLENLEIRKFVEGV